MGKIMSNRETINISINSKLINAMNIVSSAQGIHVSSFIEKCILECLKKGGLTDEDINRLNEQ